MTLVSFQQIDVNELIDLNTRCAICLKSLENSMTVLVHMNKDGMKHPWHEKCIKSLIEAGHVSCPSCKVKLDKTTLLNPPISKAWKIKTTYLCPALLIICVIFMAIMSYWVLSVKEPVLAGLRKERAPRLVIDGLSILITLIAPILGLFAGVVVSNTLLKLYDLTSRRFLIEQRNK